MKRKFLTFLQAIQLGQKNQLVPKSQLWSQNVNFNVIYLYPLAPDGHRWISLIYLDLHQYGSFKIDIFLEEQDPMELKQSNLGQYRIQFSMQSVFSTYQCPFNRYGLSFFLLDIVSAIISHTFQVEDSLER